jgi:hypothetical protein
MTNRLCEKIKIAHVLVMFYIFILIIKNEDQKTSVAM